MERQLTLVKERGEVQGVKEKEGEDEEGDADGDEEVRWMQYKK